MNKRDNDIWFPAKMYGWGWGFPIAWQGWLVFLGYVVMLFVSAYLLLPERRVLFFGLFALLTGILSAICYAKGAKLRWRWGRDS